jgi:hypothetical protein
MRLIVREDKIEEKEEGNIGREDSFYRIMGIGMGKEERRTDRRRV